MTPEELLDLFVFSPVGLVTLDGAGTVGVANPAAKRLLHPFLRDGELSPMFDVLSPWVGDLGSRARDFPEPHGVVEEGRSLVTTGARDEGSALLLSLVKRAPDQFVALVTDAREVATLRAETGQLRDRLRAIDQGIRDYALYVVDSKGLVVSWSASAERVYQCSAASMVGQSMALLSPADSGGVAHIRHVLDGARRDGWIEEEAFRVRSDGTPFWATTVVTALDGSHEATAQFQVITRDLSERRRLEEQAREGVSAAIDDLTGVTTRRSFYELAATEIARARRYKHPLTILLVDPDRFRELNESHGTAFGDECLRAIAVVCRQESRTTDVIGRVGGEEFAVLLPSTELSGGLVLAERIRERMQRHVFPGANSGVRCTLCVGVAELGEQAPSVDTLLGQAETAVTRAKQSGRNLVVGLENEE